MPLTSPPHPPHTHSTLGREGKGLTTCQLRPPLTFSQPNDNLLAAWALFRAKDSSLWLFAGTERLHLLTLKDQMPLG